MQYRNDRDNSLNKMTSLLSRTEVLAIRCIDDYIFIGMGPNLYSYSLFCHFHQKFDNLLYPNNIHGITIKGNDARHCKLMAVFGARSICIFNLVVSYNMTIDIKSTAQFNDWIIAAEWISFKDQMQLAILFAHNYISIYDISNKTCQVVRCEETCILYGGSILGTCLENLVIFSGTVFKEILIWKIDCEWMNDINKKMPVLHRLTGHKGVVFSVVCDPSSRLICSTSDDRSVRFWKIAEDENSESNNVNWQTAKIVPIKTIFRHTARVWKALIRNDIVLTIGEDSLVCKWSLSGNLLGEEYCMAPVWSIDVSKHNEVCVGRGDGSVHSLFFEDYQSLHTISLPDSYHFPKYVFLMSDGGIVVVTELGTLLHYNKDMDLINTIDSPGCCIVQKYYYRLALASREGYVIIYEADNIVRESKKIKIENSQIFSLQWMTHDILVTCGENGLLTVFRLDSTCSDYIVIAKCILPPSRERWLTAAKIYRSWHTGILEMLICGDRAGDIHVYKLEDNFDNQFIEKPIQTLRRVHGYIGVQRFDIFPLRDLRNETVLITSGRDGMLRFYEIREKDPEPLLMLHKKKMPMDWISGTYKCSMLLEYVPEENMLFIIGFKEAEFIIYNLITENVIARIPCGGGHRSWDLLFFSPYGSMKVNSEYGSTKFACIKNKQIHVYQLPSIFPRAIYMGGFHTKETCCLRCISIKKSHKIWENIFISGGEDCTLRISSVSTDNLKRNCFRNMGSFDGHLSGIKCLSLINVSDFDYLVFSGGGRAQLKAWKLQFKVAPIFCKDQVIVSCSDVNSHMLYGQNRYLHGKKPWREVEQSYIAEPETRYMHICPYYSIERPNFVLVFIACADGYLRLLVYVTVTNVMYMKVSTKCTDRCILKIHVLSHKSKVIVLTMSTDGKLRFFDFTDMVSKIYDDACDGNENVVNFNDIPFTEFSIHQSGINCFDLMNTFEDEYLLVTGGDDNLLSVICFQISMLENNNLSAKILSKWSSETIHSAQIVGVRLKGDKICSVGVDQKVVIYNYSYSNGVLHVEILNQVFTSVTDVQGMELYNSFKRDDSNSTDDVSNGRDVNHCDYICIYGRGFEILSI